MNLIQRFMGVFFSLLYHPFAFAYDLVAATVSFGKWNDWVYGILPFVQGTRILELGHGPGHLQRSLLNRGLFAVAIDESAQMGTLAKRRLGGSQRLARAHAQKIPFAARSFDTIIATFPTEYIFDKHTLSEAYRVLQNSGKLIVLPAVWPKISILAWLYKITGESPGALDEVIKERFGQSFIHAGFQTEIKVVEVQSSRLLIVFANKENNGKHATS